MAKHTTIWCYLDGKKFADVVQWALGANMTVRDAKKYFVEKYTLHEVTFKIQ